MNKIIKDLENKDILILGFGREGQSTLAFLRKYFPKKVIGVADRNEMVIGDKFVKIFSGKCYLSCLSGFDVIFKSPGIPNRLSEIKLAKKTGIKVTSQAKLFFDLCEGQIVGVTGTKGKSTTTSLIFEILQEAKIGSVILGNIGRPSLDYLEEDFGRDKVFVFEMSSHQLSDLTKSPYIAVFLNIFREHLDYYENFDEYFNAKANIGRFQSKDDYFIYNSNQKLISDFAKKVKSKVSGFSKWEDKFEKIIPLKEIPLLGEHNLNNVMAAILVAKIFEIEDEIVRRAIRNFKPLDHRLDNVGTYKGITFYDDTLATIPEATIAAMKTFSGKVQTIILGGSDRGQDFSGLAKVILEEKIKNLILFPVTGERIWRDVVLQAQPDRMPKHFFVDNMKDAVKFAYKVTSRGKICLLSSASPSFSIFKDYEDKSRQYREEIKHYK